MKFSPPSFHVLWIPLVVGFLFWPLLYLIHFFFFGGVAELSVMDQILWDLYLYLQAFFLGHWLITIAWISGLILLCLYVKRKPTKLRAFLLALYVIIISSNYFQGFSFLLSLED